MPENFFYKIFSLTTEAMAFWALVLGIFNTIYQLVPKFLKPKIEIIITPNQGTIGFNTLGATFATTFTFYGIRKDVFIRNISAKIVLERDNLTETHIFSWLTFNEYRIDPSRPFDIPRLAIRESATPFLVPVNSPKKLSVLFVDPTVKEAVASIVLRASQLFVENQGGLEALQALSADVVKDEALRSREIIDAYSQISRENYWKRGRYYIEFMVETREAGTIPLRREFSIEEEHEKQLRNDEAGIIHSNLGTETQFHPIDIVFE